MPPPKTRERSRPSLSNITTTVRSEIEVGSSDDNSSPRKLVSKMAVSSKNVLATADNSGRVKLWDLNSGDLLEQLPKHPAKEPKAISFSPNGKWLAYHIEGVLHVVDVSNIEATGVAPHTSNSQPNDEEAEAKTPEGFPGLNITDAAELHRFVPKEGARIDVRSRGRWYPATITRKDGGVRWQIHYDDSPDDWDELITERRMRPRNDP